MLSTLLQMVSLATLLNTSTVCVVDQDDNGVSAVACDVETPVAMYPTTLVGGEGAVIKGASALAPCGVQHAPMGGDITL